ncbi:uncharacterized protein K452DRAFT_312762 [Aplosporella prunicola CBS 121167]|uniref:Uncharacterized protein n=1 Tax=Aplosporella prunicola CBS 121167 TaxID=1176127 RepID=A0A6A6B158_9PEZI|nr:uncharacterized protein K452DRAFT_312762 [Aplosporella prunicola CBS 121167]KAF2136954.1 hypothetical protein K452DRAFT_312762 [Aplosporella prunicola CBS 121167]
MVLAYISRNKLNKEQIGWLANLYLYQRWTSKVCDRPEFIAFRNANGLSNEEASFFISKGMWKFLYEIEPVFNAAPGDVIKGSMAYTWALVMELAKGLRETAEENISLFTEEDNAEFDFWPDAELDIMLDELPEGFLLGDGHESTASDAASDTEEDVESGVDGGAYDFGDVAWPQSKRALARFACMFRSELPVQALARLRDYARAQDIPEEEAIQQLGRELTEFCKEVHRRTTEMPDDDDDDEDDYDAIKEEDGTTFKLGRYKTLEDGTVFDQATRLPLYVRDDITGEMKAHSYVADIDWDSQQSITELNTWANRILRRNSRNDFKMPWTQTEKDWVVQFFQQNMFATYKTAYTQFKARFTSRSSLTMAGFCTTISRHGLRISRDDRMKLKKELKENEKERKKAERKERVRKEIKKEMNERLKEEMKKIDAGGQGQAQKPQAEKPQAEAQEPEV